MVPSPGIWHNSRYFFYISHLYRKLDYIVRANNILTSSQLIYSVQKMGRKIRKKLERKMLEKWRGDTWRLLSIRVRRSGLIDVGYVFNTHYRAPFRLYRIAFLRGWFINERRTRWQQQMQWLDSMSIWFAGFRLIASISFFPVFPCFYF